MSQYTKQRKNTRSMWFVNLFQGDSKMIKFMKSRSFRKFSLSFFITIFVIFAVAGGAYAALRMSIRPPEVAEFVRINIPIPPPRPPEVNVPAPNPETNTEAATTDEEEPEEPTDEPEPEYEEVIFQKRPYFFTFLFYGLDRGNNVDAIMVAAFDAEAGKAYLLSLPRDTRVVTDRGGRQKLVLSYHAGRTNGGGHEGGIEQLMTEVSSIIGFRPDFYVGVNQRAFIRLIDAIGGVEVTIPFRMVYNDEWQDLHIDLLPGRRTLGGQQALHFARFRQFNEDCPYWRNFTDFQRVENQQTIINAAIRELLSPRTITRIPELVRIYQENVNTNLTAFEIAWFVEQLPGLHAESLLTTYSLPIARTIRQGWYEIPDAEKTLELVNRTINPFIQDIRPEMLRIAE
jgi:LCP family protein required for cell wall assembly